MTSPRGRAQAWFALAAGVILLVLSWLTIALLRLGDDEREARRHAAAQERSRLALWRMDSWLSPQIARESMRPASDYRPFPSAPNVWTKGFNPIGADQVLLQSPLLGAQSALFPLHFEVQGKAQYYSPQVPVGNERDFAEANGVAAEVLDAAARRLAAVQKQLSFDLLVAAVGGAEAALPMLGCNVTGPETPAQVQQSVQELSNRQRAFTNVANDLNQYANPGTWMVKPEERIGPMVPIWVDSEPDILLFARRVQEGGKARIQAVLVDWEVLQRDLLSLARDLFDGGELQLQRCEEPSAAEQPAMLASVPARLLADYRGTVASPALPITTILWTTWGVTLLGLFVLGFTLRTALGFGERRARFASAVTHELRTPLTTFRMYSEMLADGMVTEPGAQREYLRTLQRESDRLSRVVENVLAWSRLEEGRFASRREEHVLADLVERIVPTLSQRLSEVELELDVHVAPAALDARVVTDEEAVGQVLFNLVDNAAKYARRATRREVRLGVDVVGDEAQLTVCDYGPGVDAAHRKSIFVPFDRGAMPSNSNDVPGVGLGLPLARGLARDLGGDLRLEEHAAGGACFVLALKLA